MKINVFLKIITVFIIFPLLLTCILKTQSASNTIEVKYEYNEETNQVTAKIVSDTELKKTKPTWMLSEDKKTYTKTFSSNMNYNTPIEDINGKIIEVNINVTQIQPAKVKAQYTYDENTNQVTAQIISNTELKETKPTWNLSTDRKVYMKTFLENTCYTTPVEDINGNIIDIEVNVTQVRIANLEIQYEYDENKNQVKASVVSDLELKETKPTWNLSNDKKVYTKIYTANEEYITTFVDRYDNMIDVIIKIDQIDVIPPQITVEYKYNDNETVTVYMRSDKLLKDTKPTWTLSEDKKTYEKTFDSNQNYSTQVQDWHGIETNVNIDFKFLKLSYNQKDGAIVSIRYLYTEHKKADVEIISSVQMKDTKPTWVLSDGGYKYSKTYYEDQIYGTKIEDINGTTRNVNLIVNISDKYLNGIDVSVHQGTIDWEKVKKSGIDFAIIRCGYGQDKTEQDDKQFVRNVAECERLGIPYGIYLYSYALNVENALSEADHVLRLIKGHNPVFGIWYDIEDADGYKKNNGMPTNETFVDIAIAFCEKIKENGYQNIGIYANLDWLENQLNSSKLDKYVKWVAQWGANCTYRKEYKMWQYTDSGAINGIEGNVDMNIYYK